jgi:hypothetical protein
MAIALITDTLTIPLAKELSNAVKEYLEKRKNTEKEKEELKKTLVKLVDLSNNSAIALTQYVALLKRSTEASVHCTELARILANNPNLDATSQFEKVIDVRLQSHLLKEGIEGIHKYRDDYEKASGLYSTVEQHITHAMNYHRKDPKLTCVEIGYANTPLNELVVLANRRIQELVEGLQEAYKVLGK